MQEPLSPSAPTPQSQTTGGVSRKRRVSFSHEVMVRPYYFSPRTTTVKEQLWYSQEELRRNRIIDRHEIDMLRQAAAFVSEKALILKVESLSEHAPWCSQGLESMYDGGQQKAKNKLRGVVAVLMEQRRQDKEREWDERQIAMRYQRATQKCQDEAHHRAMRDSVAVKMTVLDNGIASSSPTKLSQLSLVAPQTVLSRAA